MKLNRTKLLITFVIGFFVFVVGNTNSVLCQSRTGNYQITIYVDEGRGQRNGHVFFGLSNGQNTSYFGWHPTKRGVGALLALNGGEIRNDSNLVSSCKWDVKKTYNITKEGLDRALDIVTKWNTDGRAWAITHHCGDFAEAVALAAGVPIKLPKVPFDMDNRPALFGEYLREPFYVNRYVNTGTAVKRGDKISFTASGEVKFGDWVGWGGPDGIYGVSTSYNHFSNMLHGSLIGRIRTENAGANDGWVYIGYGGEMIASTSGVLELNVNDKQPDNNSGHFEVEVKVCSTK